MTNSNPRIDGSTSSEYLFAVGSDVDFQFEDLPEPSDEEASLNDPYLSDVEGPVLSRKDRRTSGASCSLRPSSSSKHYAVLTLEDVEQMAQAIVEETSDILTVDHFVAEYLLHKYRWESSILAQDWIEDTQRVAKKAGIGLPTQPPQETSVENPAEAFLCPITADVVPMAETDALSCGHRFSNECWSRYLELTVTEEGAEACLAKQCPMYDCRVPIPLGFWKRHLSASSYSKLLQFRSQALVDYNASLRWCTSPSCNKIIKNYAAHAGDTLRAVSVFSASLAHHGSAFRLNEPNKAGSRSSMYALPQSDVTCSCGNRFCFFCGASPHAPVPCSIIKQWNHKNQNEEENVTWVIVHTKDCPGCKHPIEKNQGCMHMKCRCGHEFCWLCLTDWRKHNEDTPYTCNIFESNPTAHDAAEKRQRAKECLDKYVHYYERYQAHDYGQRIALEKQVVVTEFLRRFFFAVCGDFLGLAACEGPPSYPKFGLTPGISTLRSLPYRGVNFWRRPSIKLLNAGKALAPSIWIPFKHTLLLIRRQATAEVVLRVWLLC